jgi:hypothetical protein
LYRSSIKLPPEKDPTKENKKTYENKVPEIIPCPKTFRKISKKYCLGFKIKSETKIGRFAKPSRIKGTGLGIKYSILDKNKQNAPNKIVLFMVLVTN